ncbi:sterile alpha motif domain-containing protein 1-like [Eptesicus fuscus]|uniref:sterile alpha motif domain-containing protein 1-like n=1 Tax=Eptesicus fuscus TaxID=29078 RepID=UPI002404800F|nr:sterile alpha motif domain-containing protein 1-like [Eptesicus fuscus]
MRGTDTARLHADFGARLQHTDRDHTDRDQTDTVQPDKRTAPERAVARAPLGAAGGTLARPAARGREVGAPARAPPSPSCVGAAVACGRGAGHPGCASPSPRSASVAPGAAEGSAPAELYQMGAAAPGASREAVQRPDGKASLGRKMSSCVGPTSAPQPLVRENGL